MGDVHCKTCGESWDTFYLKEDLVHEAEELPASTVRTFEKVRKLTPRIRQALEDHGWVFGDSVYVVRHCPCCRPEDNENREETEAANVIASISGDDEDGLEADLEDFGF